MNICARVAALCVFTLCVSPIWAVVWRVADTTDKLWGIPRLEVRIEGSHAWLSARVGTCHYWLPTFRAAVRVDSNTPAACRVGWTGSDTWRLRPTAPDTVLWDVCAAQRGWLYAQATPDGLWVFTDTGEFDLLAWPPDGQAWNTSRAYRVWIRNDAWGIHPEWRASALRLPAPLRNDTEPCVQPGLGASEHTVWVSSVNELSGLQLRHALHDPSNPACLVYEEPRDAVPAPWLQISLGTLSSCLSRNFSSTTLTCWEWAWTVSPPSWQTTGVEPTTCWEICWQPSQQSPFIRSGPTYCR